ncbi:lipid A hydroxylase LpxO [Acinetobacter nematophilus]|uniref:Lipid A hydroxylase LpxO n=1 Tax=Acinetobacter nematophilus TaxID=2994642 RepID=A0A9X3IH09_9GAMM|nr:lipid A hydroxylase LpxO [Acinetobacter nematophilus]MCX5468443.1 lipid A hydroxylase LpxO [Acinetobacter nematophilus]
MIKWIILAIFVISALYIQNRGKVRHSFYRQFFDHSTILAPINFLMYMFSKVPNQPYIDTQYFKDLKVLDENWEMIRDEAQALYAKGGIKASSTYDDLGFNSFFKTGWKRFYLKWYDSAHPSAAELCPKTTALLKTLPTIKAAMFTELAPDSRLVRHRDPYAGSLRYHLGLITPNDDRCFIDVDGQRYSWRDGESVVFDETYIHYAENTTNQNRIIFFADVERPLKTKLMQRFNHWFGKKVMTAASSPNEAGDQTGGLNKVFGYVYQIRIKAKALKKSNRALYYFLKWFLMLGIFFLIFIRPYMPQIIAFIQKLI